MPDCTVEGLPPATQLPEIAKHPPEMSKPLVEVVVAPEVILRDPPVIVRPPEEERPAVTKPPANVEVAVPELLIAPESPKATV